MEKVVILGLAICFAPALAQANLIPEMLSQYEAEGGSNFDAAAGKKMWSQEFASEDGDMRSCATCHNSDVRTAGKHKKTGKVIAAMAPSVPFVALEEGDEPRYTDVKKIEKWFKRNCKWTYGRECTVQEKGDFLMFLKDQ